MTKTDESAKSHIAPPLAACDELSRVGGDQGEGDMNGCNSILFTLTLALSRQGRGNYWTFYETVKYGILNVECRSKVFYPSRASGSNDRF